MSSAYARLRDAGYSQVTARLPELDDAAVRRAHHPTTARPATDPSVLDLAHAALPALRRPSRQRSPPRQRISPRHLGGHGYDIRGLPELRSALADYYGAAGLPTTPEHILVTHGAQHGLALALRLYVGGGYRVLDEHPTYPNALDAVRRAGGRLVPAAMDRERGWDVEMLEATTRQSAPRLAYLVPDFQNPTGHCDVHAGTGADRRAAANEDARGHRRDTARARPWLARRAPAVRGRRRIR